MSAPVRPSPGNDLSDENDIVALVIDPTWTDDQIQELLDEYSIGIRWERDTWHYMTFEQCRGELGFVPEVAWWAPHGAGATSIDVAEILAWGDS